MATTATHYDILGIPSHSAPSTIRRAFLNRSLEWHPDRLTNTSSAALFTRARVAYEVLSDAARRARYDAALQRVVTDVVALDEMDLVDAEMGIWAYDCRCGGAFEVDEELFESNDGFEVVECDTCSLAVRVVVREREQGLKRIGASCSRH